MIKYISGRKGTSKRFSYTALFLAIFLLSACSNDDGDTVVNAIDNCPLIDNEDQADLDGDGVGDACDTDRDGDTVLNVDDNCPITPNQNQADQDADGSGDECDLTDDTMNADLDNDGILNDVDNCPLYPNSGQGDVNRNGTGDHCECKFTAQIEELGPWQQVDNTVAFNTPTFTPTGCQQNSVATSGDQYRIIIFNAQNAQNTLNSGETVFNIFTYEYSDDSTPSIGISETLEEQRSCAILASCFAEVTQ